MFVSLLAVVGFLLTIVMVTPVVSGAAKHDRHAKHPKVGYFLVSFPVQDEAVYMHLSNGNDPHSYRRLSRNGSQAILRSNVGSKGVRDHFIVPARHGSKFWLHATDLKVNDIGGNFDQATRFGSRSIVIWESHDLVNWGEPRLSAPLVNGSAGNVWAPESYFDPLQDAYVVIFASRFWPDSDPQRTGPQPPNKLMYSLTNDFVTFSTAKEYFAPSYPVIDATFLRMAHEGAKVWYRWVKAEGENMFFQQRSSDGILGQWSNVGDAPDNARIEFAKEYENNEGPLVFRDNVDRSKFHLWIDENTLQAYIPATANTLNDMAAWKTESLDGFPQHIKHGHVLAVNQAQYNRIQAGYQTIAGQ